MQGFENIKILDVNVNKTDKKITVKAQSDKFITYNECVLFKKKMCEQLGIDCVELKLMCTKDFKLVSMQPAFMGSLFDMISDKYISVSSFIKDAKCDLLGDTLTITLMHGGAELLSTKKLDFFISDCIKEMWNCHVSVNFKEISTEKKPTQEETVAVPFSENEYSSAIKARTASSSNDAYRKVYNGSGGGYNNKGDGITRKKKLLTPEEGKELPKDNEDCEILMGKDITDPITRMKDLSIDSGFVAVKGKVFKVETKNIPSGSVLAMIHLTDNSYSVTAKFFFDKADTAYVEKHFEKAKNLHLKIYGEAIQDKYTRELTIMARSIASYKPEKRKDNAEVKRVELHLHTSLSALDAVTNPSALIKRVNEWGHRAVAITDHGVVQAYPDIFNAASADKASNLKVIYGMEGYLTHQSGELSGTENKISKEEAKKHPTHHIIILVQNQIGLKNLYKLISMSNLNYFYKKPRLPKSILEQYREGLILGSACSEGELFDAVLNGESDERLCEIASFYDYLEIQPTKNDMYLVRQGKVNNLEEIENINKKIIELADRLGKMTVATCDVHFLDPDDEIFRCVMQAGQGYSDADSQPPLYLRTTNEMLSEFEYLGDRAFEIVVENTNKIADMIDVVRPVPKGNFPPVIKGSDDILSQSCHEKAKRMYGDPLPLLVEQRLEKELHSIIGNGFSVMYVTAKELVAESERNGYQVGSRGSVGSSLAAFMSDITEVNSLPAHYRCPNCKYVEFHENEGLDCCFDLPEKDCPNCNEPLIRDGYDIPFETFLGFKGEKTPDIDLNFAPTDQPSAHKYCEVLFGSDYVFRAGTISGLAEKTARGYVLKYLEERNMHASEAEIERLASGFIGVKRTTGQHPGGIMVIPKDKEIYDFTPIQRPADAVDSSTITTHFDYHFLHDSILKLDILGHDGPEMIKLLEDFTGKPCREIKKLDDDKVMSLFNSSAALNLIPELTKIKIPLGTLGIPEFGTNFVQNMLIETKPNTISELVRISGLSHGTDVWSGNAQELIKQGKVTLSQAICCRDDIMLYLINKGVDAALSFNIMEKVRKGKGLTKDWEVEMAQNDVPDWYIESCNKIKYMFPKAHAVAYVMLSVRIAWYKIYYPLAYYAARFSIKVDDFDAANMTHGADKAISKMTAISTGADNKAEGETVDTAKNNVVKLTAKEEDQLAIYEQVLEMYARGYEFLPIDLYKSQAKNFVPEDGKIRPPLGSIQGLGVAAAENIVNARNNGCGEFFSVEELKTSAGLNKTVIESLRNEGCLEGLPESNQLSLF